MANQLKRPREPNIRGPEVESHYTHPRYCGGCGTKLNYKGNRERVTAICPNCGREYPVVIE